MPAMATRGAPDLSILFGPAAVFGPLSPAYPGRTKEHLAASVRETRISLERLLSLRAGQPALEVDASGEVRYAGGREGWMAALEAIRATIKFLRGTTARAFIRDVSLMIPDEAPDLIRLHNEGVAFALQLQASFAFMLGEDDEPGIQGELIPSDQADRAPAPSVSIDLT